MAEQIDPLSLGHMTKTLLALVFVCALAVLLVGKLGPWLNARGEVSKGAPSKRRLKVIERVSLDRENQMVIVDTGEENLLLAVGPQGTRTLGVLNSEGRFEESRDETLPEELYDKKDGVESSE